MKKLICVFILIFSSYFSNSQNKDTNHAKIKEDFNEIISNLSKYDIYFHEKNIDLNNIKEYDESQTKNDKKNLKSGKSITKKVSFLKK